MIESIDDSGGFLHALYSSSTGEISKFQIRLDNISQIELRELKQDDIIKYFEDKNLQPNHSKDFYLKQRSDGSAEEEIEVDQAIKLLQHSKDKDKPVEVFVAKTALESFNRDSAEWSKEFSELCDDLIEHNKRTTLLSERKASCRLFDHLKILSEGNYLPNGLSLPGIYLKADDCSP